MTIDAQFRSRFQMNGSLENTIKEMILREELPPGERVTEAGLSARLGVSRTPIRNILPRLAAEGFLQPVGKRGFVVSDFGENEIYEALDLRAVMEGWAARKLAEQGADAKLLAELDACLEWGDKIFDKQCLDLDDEQEYGRMNERFHQLIIDGCSSAFLSSFIDRLNNVPFVAPSVIVFDQIGLRAAYNMLHRAHGFHHAIVDAIKRRDGSRAEFLFKEHANHQQVSMFERRRSKGAPALSPTPTKSRKSARTTN